MMNKLIAGLIFLIVSTDVYSQMKFTTDDLSNMIVCIADRQGASIKAVGTATIISDSLRFFVLTAAHVTDSLKGECFLIFRVDKDRPVVVRWSNKSGHEENLNLCSNGKEDQKNKAS